MSWRCPEPTGKLCNKLCPNTVTRSAGGLTSASLLPGIAELLAARLLLQAGRFIGGPPVSALGASFFDASEDARLQVCPNAPAQSGSEFLNSRRQLNTHVPLRCKAPPSSCPAATSVPSPEPEVLRGNGVPSNARWCACSFVPARANETLLTSLSGKTARLHQPDAERTEHSRCRTQAQMVQLIPLGAKLNESRHCGSVPALA